MKIPQAVIKPFGVIGFPTPQVGDSATSVGVINTTIDQWMFMYASALARHKNRCIPVDKLSDTLVRVARNAGASARVDKCMHSTDGKGMHVYTIKYYIDTDKIPHYHMVEVYE